LTDTITEITGDIEICEICGKKERVESLMNLDGKRMCGACIKNLVENKERQKIVAVQPAEEKNLNQEQPMKTHHLGCLIICAIIVLAIGGCMASNSIEESQKKEEKYNEAIESLRKHDYQKATLMLLGETYKESKLLYEFAEAEQKKETDPKMTQYYLKSIPDTYKGEFSDEIKTLRESTKGKAEEQIKKEQKIEKEQKKEHESKVYIGDSQYKVLDLWGNPQRKNRTVVGNVVHEQWIYGNTYIYIENGVVTAFQD